MKIIKIKFWLKLKLYTAGHFNQSFFFSTFFVLRVTHPRRREHYAICHIALTNLSSATARMATGQPYGSHSSAQTIPMIARKYARAIELIQLCREEWLPWRKNSLTTKNRKFSRQGLIFLSSEKVPSVLFAILSLQWKWQKFRLEVSIILITEQFLIFCILAELWAPYIGNSPVPLTNIRVIMWPLY